MVVDLRREQLLPSQGQPGLPAAAQRKRDEAAARVQLHGAVVDIQHHWACHDLQTRYAIWCFVILSLRCKHSTTGPVTTCRRNPLEPRTEELRPTKGLQ